MDSTFARTVPTHTSHILVLILFNSQQALWAPMFLGFQSGKSSIGSSPEHFSLSLFLGSLFLSSEFCLSFSLSENRQTVGQLLTGLVHLLLTLIILQRQRVIVIGPSIHDIGTAGDMRLAHRVRQEGCVTRQNINIISLCKSRPWHAKSYYQE